MNQLQNVHTKGNGSVLWELFCTMLPLLWRKYVVITLLMAVLVAVVVTYGCLSLCQVYYGNVARIRNIALLLILNECTCLIFLPENTGNFQPPESTQHKEIELFVVDGI